MKVGADQRGKLIALVALLVLGAVAYFWGGGIGGSIGQAVFTSSPARLPDLTRLDPTLHLDALDRIRATTYQGTGRDLFHIGPPPAPPAPVRPPTVSVTPAQSRPNPAAANGVAAGPPPPQAMPLKFYGSVAPAGGAVSQVFLLLGDKVNIVKEGDVIEGRYRIERINPLSVHVKDIQTNQEQDLPLFKGQS